MNLFTEKKKKKRIKEETYFLSPVDPRLLIPWKASFVRPGWDLIGKDTAFEILQLENRPRSPSQGLEPMDVSSLKN